MAEGFQNLWSFALTAQQGATDTTLTVNSTTGAPSNNFRIKVDTEYQLVTVTNATLLTCVGGLAGRGLENGSAAAIHSNGAPGIHVLTAGALTAAFARVDGINTFAGDQTIGNTFRLLFATAAGKIVPGATSISLRKSDDSADNGLMLDAGDWTVRHSMQAIGVNTGTHRFVGQTSGGPPTSGTWAVGDEVFDSTTFGSYMCITAGTPGTWVAFGGALTSPKAPTLVITGGAAGAYTYYVVAVNSQGDAIPSAVVSTSVGPTTLDGTHFIDVNWTAPVGCAPGNYKVIRSAGGASQGIIGTVSGSTLTLRDNALVASVYTAATVNPGGGFVCGGQAYRFRVYRNAVFTPGSSGAFVNLPYDTKLYDLNNNYDAVTNFRYTAPVGGYYWFAATAFGSTTTRTIASIYKITGGGAATEMERGVDINTAVTSLSLASGEMYLNAGDTVDGRVFQTTAGSLNIGEPFANFTGAYRGS